METLVGVWLYRSSNIHVGTGFVKAESREEARELVNMEFYPIKGISLHEVIRFENGFLPCGWYGRVAVIKQGKGEKNYIADGYYPLLTNIGFVNR